MRTRDRIVVVHVALLIALSACGDDGRGSTADAGGDDGKNAYYYGDPRNALTFFACLDDETDSNVGLGRYRVCLPECPSGSCPATPEGATAMPRCETMGTPSQRCYLFCAGSAECPSGMSCIPDRGYCAFERTECTEDATVCPDEMECLEAGTTGTFFCEYPR